VNRLLPILDGMVSPTQSTFIPGRLITNNDLIAFECLHTMGSTKDDKVIFCAYKLDMPRACDRVD
jgi:hypothetical protein